MQEIIPPVDRELLKAELNKDVFLRYTNNGNNEIYLINYHNSPNAMREIGRLRELTFRGAGGGTGLSIDIDENDTCDDCYDHSIVLFRRAKFAGMGHKKLAADFICGQPGYTNGQCRSFIDDYDCDIILYRRNCRWNSE